MDNGSDILRLCRLCLVKDKVDIPIFDDQDDIKQIYQKISSCLPVKVSREDKLPKKICDGCSYKLDIFYDFWNGTANAEKQLLTWLGEADMSKLTDSAISAVAQQIKTSETVVKQETIDPSDIHTEENDDDKDYVFPQKFSEEEAGPSATATSNEEPPPKRARRTAAVKAQIAMDPESDDDDDSGEPLTKMEDESEESEGEDHEPTFVDVPSTSADDQPGPSGVGKDGAEAPLSRRRGRRIKKEIDPDYIAPKVKEIDNIIIPKDEPVLSDDSMRFTCELCDDKIETSIDFALHSIKHSADSKYHCHHCPFKTTMVKRIRKHMKTHGNTGKFFQCESCPMIFPECEQAIEHKNFHSGEMPFKCEKCEKHFMFSWLLRTHSRLYHLGSKNMKMDLSSLTCNVCKMTFRTRSGLRKHVLRKHNSVPKEPPLCDICGKCLASNETLKFHRRTHTGYKPHTCSTCGKSFCKKGLLVEHERVHTGEKPFICRFCEKGFSQRAPLKIHLRIHTGERPYICRLCGKGCICKSVLDAHMRNCSGVMID